MPYPCRNVCERSAERVLKNCVILGLTVLLAGGLVFVGIRTMTFHSRQQQTAAMLRTTMVPTIIQTGVKDNVIPQHARAVINFRIQPGQTIVEVISRVGRIIDDKRITVRPVGFRREASKVSRIDDAHFRMLQKSIGEAFPGTVVAPFLLIGGTDSRYYYPICDHVYRFQGTHFSRADLARIHGTDERISVAELRGTIQFLIRLLRNSREG